MPIEENVKENTIVEPAMSSNDYQVYINNQFFIIDCLKRQIIEKDVVIAKLMNKVNAMKNEIKVMSLMFIEED